MSENVVPESNRQEMTFDDATKRLNQHTWDKLARVCARDAHKYDFSSRRGVYPIDGIPVQPNEVLCIYNNNPYAADAGLRDDETTRLRTRLHSAKIEELGYATYPATSRYTYAMILAVSAEQLPVIRESISEVARESFERLQQRGISQAFVEDLGIGKE